MAPVQRGDTVFISAAAGAVGSVAGQLARRLGATTVIGSAGGSDKAARLVDDFGLDIGLDRCESPIGAQLAEVAPGGIDVYLDNVGGDHLEAAIAAARAGRCAGCSSTPTSRCSPSGPSRPQPGSRTARRQLAAHRADRGGRTRTGPGRDRTL
ncbi:zinc-binding dehydrogenase [Actinomadura fulvescens]|uniref:Alcohol dehydrogenase-like C-terminal domain-containing protein n=1 Tax=Actinomadura fulvescens TaxID=46160 RepID=A0ABP6CNP4_9ACTN